MRPTFILTLLLLAVGQHTSADGPPHHLVSDGTAASTAPLDGPAWLVRERRVTLASAAIAASDNVRLSLFEDVDLVAAATRIERRYDGGYTWFGAIDGDGSAVLVVNGSRVAAAVRHRGHLYTVAYQHDGGHLVSEIDPRRYPPEGEPLAAGDDSGARQPASSVDDGTIIDILIVYTDDVAAAVPDIAGLAQLAIDETNLAYAQSAAVQRLRLIGLEQVDYDESGDGYLDLDRLTSTTDGSLDEVHVLRDECAADVVSMWLEDLGHSGFLCGLGWQMQTISPAFAASAFNVVSRACAVGGMTFAHELGHNMGLNHDRANASGPGATAYAYGHQDTVTPFRTVMAYNCSGGCPRVPHFSNPDIFYAGRRTGTPHSDADPTDNARTLDDTGAIVAGFRDSSIGCCVSDAGEEDDSCADASPLPPWTPQARNFCDRSSDWFVFEACAGGRYTLATSALETATDTRIDLHERDCGALLASDDDSGAGLASLLSFTAALDGSYAVRLSQSTASFGRNHGYELSLSADVSGCTTCGDGVQDPWEECDDGDTTPCDGCDEYCETEACGDGRVDCGEECDDGGTLPGDGCDASCQREATGCLPADLGVARALRGVRAPARRATFSWAADTAASEYHVTTVLADKRLLLDPTSSGSGNIECIATVPFTACTVSAMGDVGVRYYQALAACDDLREGPF